MEVLIGNCPSQELALTNLAFVSPSTKAALGAACQYVEVGNGYEIDETILDLHGDTKVGI